MADYSRRGFIKVSLAVLAGAGPGMPLMFLSGCSENPTGGSQPGPDEPDEPNESTGHWEAIEEVPVESLAAALLPTGKVMLYR
jgi:hypothetical protein